MPRRNANVRQRNLPRAAQRQPKGAQRAQLDAREDKRSTRQPSAQDRADREFDLYSGLYTPLFSKSEYDL